jgi:hypothetical protein
MRWYRQDEMAEARTMINCNFYRGRGACSGGGGSCAVYGEPRCETYEPKYGWLYQLARMRARKGRRW